MWIAIIQRRENLTDLLLIYPKGKLSKNTISIISFIDILNSPICIQIVSLISLHIKLTPVLLNQVIDREHYLKYTK